MKTIKAAFISLSALIAMSSFAEPLPETSIKQKVEGNLHEGVGVESVIKTPYSGLYEVRTSNGEILYADKEAKYIFSGHIMNATTLEDYTKARTDEINKIKFADLPFDSAIKMVKGDGKRVIAVFEDPNCGYCKHLRQTLSQMNNITVYTFMFNILAADSSVKSKNIWCSSDRLKAWDDWMLNGKAAPAAPATCTSDPNEKIFALGRKMKINGTPSIFFTDGSRIPGAVDEKTIEQKFASIK
ncbi:MAG TPA: DsbC family protein [Burkholderiaceae bacterium]|jgi:thiol:disulfide interchange protein DsbC